MLSSLYGKITQTYEELDPSLWEKSPKKTFAFIMIAAKATAKWNGAMHSGHKGGKNFEFMFW